MHSKFALAMPVLLGIILTSVLACNNAEPDSRLAREQVELDSHRMLWDTTRSSDYTFEYRVTCECSDHLDQTVKVTVLDKDIESVVIAESGEPTVDTGPTTRYHTIDSLFDVTQDAITGEADQLTVSYNSEFGYPTNIEIDYNVNAIDDEYTLTATAYSPR